MKLRESFQAFRSHGPASPTADGNAAAGPKTATATYFRIPGLRERASASASATSGHEAPGLTSLPYKSTESKHSNIQPAALQTPEPQSTSSRKSLPSIFGKTSASLRATGAQLKSRRGFYRRKTKANEPVEISDATLAALTRPPPSGKRATGEFLARQRSRAEAREPASPLESRDGVGGRREREALEGALEFASGGIGVRTMDENREGKRECEGMGHASFDASKINLEVVDVAEMPSLLSANGLDAGTVGWECFLHVAGKNDVVEDEEETILEKRTLLMTKPEELELRPLNLEYLIERLQDLGELYTTMKNREKHWNQVKINEMGEELFNNLLNLEPDGSTRIALQTQITALQGALNIQDLWRDFSREEWRVRVGQLLWSPQEFAAEQEADQPVPNERDVLLLQITLASELLIRLYVLNALDATFPPTLSIEDKQILADHRTMKIKWDLVLADRFLRIMDISARQPADTTKTTTRNSFFSAITFFSARETPEDAEASDVQPIIVGKNQEEQLAGLIYFAEQLQWPHAGEIRRDLGTKLSRGEDMRPLSTALSVYATPLGSPGFPSATTPGQRNSVFFSGDRPPGLNRKGTTQSVSLLPARQTVSSNQDNFDTSGWLTRSWISGLVMPGEAAGHLLISALLENSPQALGVLGEEADLYGGFVYEGRGFWSKKSVVGRVLAAVEGARECMGWVSVSGVDGAKEGWIGVDVKEMEKVKRAEKEDVLGGKKLEKFVWPTDGELAVGDEVKFDGVSFGSTTANLTFSSLANFSLAPLILPLAYDVHFLASHPCYPCSRRTPPPPATVSSQLSFESTGQPHPDSPTLGPHPPPSSDITARNSSTTSSTSPSARDKTLPSLPAHPLHSSIRYITIPIATLLCSPETTVPAALSSTIRRKVSFTTPPDAATAAAPSSSDEQTLILDSRGPASLHLLARAWCAQTGHHGLISKTGRTCLACSIREARAAGISVVIRI